MSPLVIRIMLFHAGRAPDDGKLGTVFDEPRSPASAEVEETLATSSLLRKLSDGTFEITEGGRMYVEALQAVPLPVRRWQMPGRARPDEGLGDALRGLRRGWDQAVSETDLCPSNGDPALMGTAKSQASDPKPWTSMANCAKCGCGRFNEVAWDDVRGSTLECAACGLRSRA